MQCYSGLHSDIQSCKHDLVIKVNIIIPPFPDYSFKPFYFRHDLSKSLLSDIKINIYIAMSFLCVLTRSFVVV